MKTKQKRNESTLEEIKISQKHKQEVATHLFANMSEHEQLEMLADIIVELCLTKMTEA